jgi:hypothetical protein
VHIDESDLQFQLSPWQSSFFDTTRSYAMAPTQQLSPEQLAALAKDDLSQLTKNIIIAFTVISFVSICLRMYTRIRYQAVGWEDYSIVLAMVRRFDDMTKTTRS